jgi:uncharacterized protein YjdB
MSLLPRSRSILPWAVLAAAACADQAPSAPTLEPRTLPVLPNFSLAASNAVQVTKSIQLTASSAVASAANASGQAILWKSSNASIASVSSKGLVTAGAVAGTVKIVDYVSTVADTIPVVVLATEVLVSTVKLAATTTSITTGKTVQLTATCYDVNGYVVPGRSISWNTSSGGIATVSSSGLVTGVGAGVATITAMTGTGAKATIAITITTGTTSTLPVKTVSVSLAPASVTTGSTSAATATAKDSLGNIVGGQTVTWTSSNSAIASVSGTTASGAVNAVAAGSATISAKVGAATGTSTITVTTGSTGGSGSVNAAAAALPLVTVNTALPAVTGKSIPVHAGGNLQQAINSAVRGDEIVIDAGITLQGNFTLPAKTGTAANGWITIRPSNMSGIPVPGVRVNPAVHAAAMPKLVTASTAAALATTSGSNGWRVIGLEITVLPTFTTTVQYGLVNLGDGSFAQNSLTNVATNIVLDRVYIHGQPQVNTKRCLGLNSASSAVIDSYLSECHGGSFDAQAIGGWNGPGPFKIENNWLEGSGENIMFGGADPAIPNLIPSDIEIRHNYIYKPLSWKGVWVIKNLLETKNARRVLVEGNVFENSWFAGQVGFAVLFKGVNQAGGCPWCTTSDVTFRSNIVRNAAAGINIAAHPEQYPAVSAARFNITQNLFENVGSNNGTSNGRMFLLLGGLNDVVITNNTAIHNAFSGTGQFIYMDLGSDAAGKNLTVRDNVATWGGPWGAVMGNGVTQGGHALGWFNTPFAFERNVVIGLPSTYVSLYPSGATGNSYPLLMASVGFVNPLLSDYTLSSLSPYKGKGLNGADPGVNMTMLRTKTLNATLP